LAPAFALSLLPFYFKHFLLTSSSSQIEKKKTIEKKNVKKGGSLLLSSRSALSLLALASGFLFLPFRFKHFLLGILFFSSKRKKRKKNAEKGGSLPFFSHFCILDETILLLSPFHIPSMLSSPPSSSLVFHVSSKLYAIQTQELSRALEME
jgi:hypothetical protein